MESQMSQLEGETNAALEAARSQVETDGRMARVEKMELERQLQATQKCYVSYFGIPQKELQLKCSKYSTLKKARINLDHSLNIFNAVYIALCLIDALRVVGCCPEVSERARVPV